MICGFGQHQECFDNKIQNLIDKVADHIFEIWIYFVLFVSGFWTCPWPKDPELEKLMVEVWFHELQSISLVEIWHLTLFEINGIALWISKWKLSRAHLSFFLLSGALSYAGEMEILTWYTYFNQLNVIHTLGPGWQMMDAFFCFCQISIYPGTRNLKKKH